MTNYAEVADVISLKRPLSPEEIERVEKIIPLVSSSLRYEAKKVGKDLDKLISEDEDLRVVAKSVTVDVAMRELMTSTEGEPMIQTSESGLGYSASGTFLVPGGGLFIKKDELRRLGIVRQRYGVIDLYGID